MPTFPVYESKQSLSANPISPAMSGQDAVMQATGNLNKTLGSIAQQWSDAQDLMQYTDAKAKFGVAIADIEARASNDPNFSNGDKYKKEVTEARQNATKGISNQQVALRAGLEFDSNAAISGIKIDGAMAKKQVDYTRAVTIPLNIKNAQDGMIGATTKAQFDQVRLDMTTDIDNQVQARILSYEEGEKIKKSSELGAATNAIYTDTEKARRQINDGYYNISAEEKSKLLSEADTLDKRRFKEQTEIQKEVQYQTEANIAQGIATNKYPSVQDLAISVERGTISPDFATVVMKTITSPAVIAAHTDNEEFANLTQSVFKSKDKQGVQKALVNILKGGGDGKLSKDDLGVLINSAMLQGQEARKDITQTIETLGTWADNSKLDKAQVFRVFQQNIAKGSNVAEASDNAMKKTIVDSVQGASALTDVPNFIVGKDSETRLIFPKKTKVSAHRIFQPQSKEKK